MPKRIFLIIAAAAALFFLSAAAALAEPGPEAQLTTDRDSYSRGDIITATVTLRNPSAGPLYSVRIEFLLPEGCAAVDGSPAVLDAGTVGAMGSVSHTCMFRTESAVVIPATGDGFPLFPLSAVFIVSLGLFLALGRKRRGASLLLALCVFCAACPAKAVDNSLRLNREVTLDGEPIDVAAVISYTSAQPPEVPKAEDISISYPGPGHLHPLGEDLFADNLIDVTASPDASPAQITSLAKEYSASVAGMIALTGDYQWLLPTPLTWTQLTALCDEISRSPLILSASPEVLSQAAFDTVHIPNDVLWQPDSEWDEEHPGGSNWNAEAIRAPRAWNMILNSAHVPVRVGVIDSMFDSSHEDLSGQFLSVWNNDPALTSEHGTHVCGIIGAVMDNGKGIAGILPDAEICAYSIQGASTDPNVADPDKTFINEYQYKYALAKMILSGCRVINVSMGASTPGGCAWQGEIDPFLTRMRNKGLDFLIIQSAGNKDIDAVNNGIFVNCTENRDRIIVVTAADLEDSSPSYAVRPGSNWGSRVDLIAPGESILSCMPGNKYGQLGGTSMAAPHVSAAAALCFSLNPSLTGEQVKDILLRSASVSVSHTAGGQMYAYPFVDAYRALLLAAATPGAEHTGTLYGTVMGRVIPRDTGVRISAFVHGTSSLADTVGLMADGQFSLLLPEGKYDLTISLTGRRTLTVAGVTVIAGQVTYLEDITLIKSSDADSGTVSGTIVDALTGLPVNGALVLFLSGWNASSAASAAGQCVTDASGYYSISLPPGYYTAVISRSGYIASSLNTSVFSGENTLLNGAISPCQSEKQLRIVLTWGADPADLDSHLNGVLSDGKTFHVYYQNTAARSGGVTVCTLDHDDTTSYGPETVTLYVPSSGVFRYSVHNYTYRKDVSGNNLANSGALAVVYRGNTLVAVFPVPNKYGSVWNVFEVRDGMIVPLNTMEYVTAPADVGNF